MAKDQDKFNVSNPSGVEAQQMEDNVDLNDNASIADEQMLQQGGNELECAVCLTHSADAWYRCPDGLGEHGTHVRKHKVMCPSCSIQWRYCEFLCAARSLVLKNCGRSQCITIVP